MEKVVYGKVKHRSVVWWERDGVQIKLLEYHGIRDSFVKSKRQATPYVIVYLEKNKYRGNPIVGFITKTVREILVESKLPEVHCLVMEDERWDHASNGNNSIIDVEEMIDKSVPYAATGPEFQVLGANPDPSLLCIERHLTLTLGGPIGPAYKKMKNWGALSP